MKKIYLPLSLIAIGLLVLAPLLIYLLTRFSWIPLSQETGYIGDTIGGITAPFLNGIAICFLYITFRQQRDAASEQERLDNFKVIMQLFEQLYDDLNNYKLTVGDITHHGSEALAEYILNLEKYQRNEIIYGSKPENGYSERLSFFKISSGGMDIIYLFQSFQIIQRQILLVKMGSVQRQVLNDKLDILFRNKMFFLNGLVPLFGEQKDDVVDEIKNLIDSFA